MTWQVYMTMKNSDLAHSLLNHHGVVCKCLERGEQENPGLQRRPSRAIGKKTVQPHHTQTHSLFICRLEDTHAKRGSVAQRAPSPGASAAFHKGGDG
jgi:uncharacterized cupin superfamily protein